MSKTPRQQKTPRQRAQEALAVEERRVKRLTEKRDQLRADLQAIDNERDQAVVRRDYLAKHPDLLPINKPAPGTGPARTIPTGDTA